MGHKKRAKKKESRLQKKLRRFGENSAVSASRDVSVEPVRDVSEVPQAVVPAELQLGGGEALGASVVPSAAAPATERSEGAPARTFVESRPAFDLFEALQERRTHKRFRRQAVPRRAIEVMLEAAILAPNHKMTEPWRFVVFGEEAKQRYGELRARMKVGRHGKAEKRAKVVDEIVAVPAMIGIKMRVDDDPARREEDYAATFMAVQNLSLAATGLGFATKINTGKILGHRGVRELVRARRNERLVALLNIGVPVERRAAKERTPASERTLWLD